MQRTDTRTVLVLDPTGTLPAYESFRTYRMRRVPDWDTLHDTLREAHPSTVVLLHPYDEEEPERLSPRVRELTGKFPSIPVAAVLPFDDERFTDMRTLAEWKVSELVDREVDLAPAALHLRLRQAHGRPFKHRLEQALPRYVAQQAMTLLYAAIEVAVDGGGAPELAEHFGVEPRTVAGWCARRGLPAPRRLQAWLRVLLAATLLEDPERTVVGVAAACGYANDHALRRAVRELLGDEDAALPREDAFDRLVRAFNTELREVRQLARDRLSRMRMESRAAKRRPDGTGEGE